MARTVEHELVDTREKMRPETLRNGDSSDKANSDKQDLKTNAPRGKRSRWILLFVFALAVAGAALWWVDSQNRESTDDAQIEGHLDLVSARISGRSEERRVGKECRSRW